MVELGLANTDDEVDDIFLDVEMGIPFVGFGGPISNADCFLEVSCPGWPGNCSC